MDRPFTGGETGPLTAPGGPTGDGAESASVAGVPDRTARATWLLAAVVTACAILASVLLPQ
jgi:hypothetical protein